MPNELPEPVRAEVHRILQRAARRLLNADLEAWAGPSGTHLNGRDQDADQVALLVNEQGIPIPRRVDDPRRRRRGA